MKTVTPAPAIPAPFAVGERVYCIVHGAWYTVVDVGAGRNRGLIKISGEQAWCPASNFTREKPLTDGSVLIFVAANREAWDT